VTTSHRGTRSGWGQLRAAPLEDRTAAAAPTSGGGSSSTDDEDDGPPASCSSTQRTGGDQHPAEGNQNAHPSDECNHDDSARTGGRKGRHATGLL
jgi:hypothetical protein